MAGNYGHGEEMGIYDIAHVVRLGHLGGKEWACMKRCSGADELWDRLR